MPTPAGYNNMVSRAAGTYSNAGGGDPLVPQPLVAEIIQELPTQSAVLRMARQVQMASTTQRQPVLNLLPSAYFVSQVVQDNGLKQTTAQQWTGVNLVVEEIAAIVPIPDSYLADAAVPIWQEVKPRLVEALGALIDGACLFGVNTPSTWSQAIVPAAIAVGNTVSATAGVDEAQSMAILAEKLTKEGWTNVNGFVARPGLGWKLVQMRSSQGLPIYQPDLVNGGVSGKLYGYPVTELTNGSFDPTVADLIMGDWSKAIVGMRQDVTWKMFDQGVITDATGKVVWNAMQNDGQAMRVVMRLAFATANPVTTLRPTTTQRYPFGVLTAPAGQQS